MDDIVKEFLLESAELLDGLDAGLVELETGNDVDARLAEIFRALHTIKGSCGFLGYAKLERLSHVGESVLSRMRDGVISASPEVMRVLYDLAEAVRGTLRLIERSETDQAADIDAIADQLADLRDRHAPPTPPTSEPAPARKDPRDENAEDHSGIDAGRLGQIASPVEVRGKSRALGEILVDRGLATPAQIGDAVLTQQAGDDRRLGEILIDKGYIKPKDLQAALESQKEDRSPSSLSENSIRVDVGLLDKLMNLVGELVLARNQVQQFTTRWQDAELTRTAHRLNIITTELQEGVMKTRMQPIGTVWNKFPRVIRHLAVVCQKKVVIEMEGQETELDKTIIEAIKDPLTHFVRNTVDHGIEVPAERRAAGKPEDGVLSLRAYHEGGQVIIQVSDDGRGIDPEVVKKKAIERGLVTPPEAANLTTKEAIALVFQPGFSTAAAVTSVSGRGVGMDVVKTNIERIGGTVDLHSVVGEGTQLKIKIPLTLAIIPALLVSSAGRQYALPQISLVELVRLEGPEAHASIESIGGASVYRLRGQLLPLVDLAHELGLEPQRPSDDVTNIVVLQAESRTFGLVVDDISDTAEIVVKPLAKQLGGLAVFAGATILGDGRISLILDVPGLATRARVVDAGDESSHEVCTASSDDRGKAEAQRLLLFEVGEDRRYAIPLTLINRLEEIPSSDIERSSWGDAVQYRDEILPLVRLSDLLHLPRAPEPDLLRVLVYQDDTRYVGLVVDRIVDIVQYEANRGGSWTPATTVIQDRITDLLDLRAMLDRPSRSTEHPTTASAA